MSRHVPTLALLDAVADFQAEVARQALAAARDIVGAVLVARRAAEARRPSLAPSIEPAVSRRRVARPAKEPRAQVEEGAVEIAEPAAVHRSEPAVTGVRGKSSALTRETIIETLVQMMISVPTVDARFMKKYGPRGFVPATLKVFGRFDAALNVAALQVSKLYPNGRPEARLAKLQFRPGRR